MDIKILPIEIVDFLESYCGQCEQPVMVVDGFGIIVITTDKRLLLAKSIPCNKCGRTMLIPKVFSTNDETHLEIIRISKIITEAKSILPIEMLEVSQS